MNENKLTDEEVWLRAYCASMSVGSLTPNECRIEANVALQMFKDEFRDNKNNERTE